MKQIHEETFIGSENEINARINEIHRKLKEDVRKKRILFLVDNHGWCWTSTANNIARFLPQYEFKIVSAKDFRADYYSLINWCDIVYMRGYPNIYLDGIQEFDKPFIFTIPTGGKNLALRLEQSAPYKNTAFACVVQNQKAKLEAERLGFKNIHVIPNGVDTNVFKPTGIEKKYAVGFAGNNEGFRAELKGTGFVKSACESLGVSYFEVTKDKRLSYEQMPGFYNSLEIYAQPSESEGCSNSVMEAMACGVPCLICEGVGYHGEQCINACDDAENCDNPGNTSGNVALVKRESEDIALKIKWLMSNQDIYRRISANSRQFAEQHAWKEIAPVHGELIGQALKSIKSSIAPVGKQCQYCEYFIFLIQFRDSGICQIESDRVTVKHKNMKCQKFKLKGVV